METLITILVLVLLSAASGWLKKRAESQEENQLPPPRTPDRGRLPPQQPVAPGSGAPEQRPVTRSWEEELRRLLEGELPPKPAPPPPKPQPLPPVLPSPRPAATPSAAAPRVTTVVREAAVAAPVVRKGSLTAQQHAQRVGERAEAELKRAELALARTLAQTHVARRGLAPEIVAARAWLSHPQSARQAVIASVILGPPVGMDSGMTGSAGASPHMNVR